MQVQATVCAPAWLSHLFSKTNMRRKDVFFMGVSWETADYYCGDASCGYHKDGYRNRIDKLKDENEQLKIANERLTRENAKQERDLDLLRRVF
jgi:hypothetical protein